MKFSVEDAKRVQRDLKLGDRHVVYIDPGEGFVMAHTDHERYGVKPLDECETHLALCKMAAGSWADLVLLESRFPKPGWYEITAIHEAKGLALLLLVNAAHVSPDAPVQAQLRVPARVPDDAGDLEAHRAVRDLPAGRGHGARLPGPVLRRPRLGCGGGQARRPGVLHPRNRPVHGRVAFRQLPGG